MIRFVKSESLYWCLFYIFFVPYVEILHTHSHTGICVHIMCVEYTLYVCTCMCAHVCMLLCRIYYINKCMHVCVRLCVAHFLKSQ